MRDGATFCTKAEDVLDALARQKLASDEGLGFAEPDVAQPDPPFWGRLESPYFDPPGTDLPGTDLPEFHCAAIAPWTAAEETPAPPTPSTRAIAPPTTSHERGRVASPPSRETIAARVVELLGPTPVPVDEIVRAADAPAREVRTILFELELAGRLERHGADLVSKI